jgi:hypothetical protein
VEQVVIHWQTGDETYALTSPLPVVRNSGRKQTWLDIPPGGFYEGAAPNIRLTVNSTIKLSRSGLTAKMPFKWVCPKGEPFAVVVRADQTDNPAFPESLGEDFGIPATGEIDGTCSGRQQSGTMDLVIQPVTSGGQTVTIPWSQSPPFRNDIRSSGSIRIGSPVYLGGGWCDNEACAEGTVIPRLVIK